MRVSTEIGLPAPTNDVWSILVDWASQSTWMRDADEVALETRRSTGIGTIVAVRTRVLGVPLFTDRLEVVAWEPPRRLVVAHRRLIRGTGEWLVTASGTGSRFRWTEDVSLRPEPIGEIVLAAYRPLLRRLMERSSMALRERVEDLR
jgi:hypothetical protein